MRLSPLILLFILSLSGCDSEEAVDPIVVTNDPQEIGQTSVVIGATITETGSVRPIQYGFMWGSSGGLNLLTTKHKIDLGSTGGLKTYSIRLDSLQPNTSYYARAYTANSDYSRIFYGNEISFKTLP